MPYSNSKKKRNMKRVKSKRAKKLKKRRSQKGGMFGWAFGKKTENVDDESKPKSIFSGLNFFGSKKQAAPPAPPAAAPPAAGTPPAGTPVEGELAATKPPPSPEAALTIGSVKSKIENASITQQEKESLVAKIKGNAVLLKQIEADTNLVAKINADDELKKMFKSDAQGSSGVVAQGSLGDAAQAPAAQAQGGKGSKKKKKKRKRKQKGGTKRK